MTLDWARNPSPPHDPCVNPACTNSVYFPDEPSWWATAWTPGAGRQSPEAVTERACSPECLAAVLTGPSS